MGIIGEYSSAVLRNFKLPATSAGFELGTEDLFQAALAAKTSIYKTSPHFPKIEQDITLQVPASLGFWELNNFVANELDRLRPQDTSIELTPTDIYQKPSDKKRKNITFRLRIAAFNRTLRTDEVNKLLDDAAAVAHAKFGAVRV